MAEDITAGRVVIEIMANAAEAERGFADAADATDDLKNSAKRTRTEVNDLGRSERAAGDNAKTMARAEGELSENLNRARKNTDNLKDAEDDLSKQNEKATKTTENLSDAEKEHAANAGKAKTNTQNLKDSVKETLGPLKDMKDAMGMVTGILGAFGISEGVSWLIGQLKDLAQQAEDARKSVEKAYQYIYYTTGDLTESQMEMYNSILSYNPQTGYKGYAGDPAKVSTAIAMLGQYYPIASPEELQKLAIEQLSLDKLGKGDLQSNIINAGKAFTKWDVAVEDQVDELRYLRTVSEETGVGFSDLLERMYSLKDFADDLGVSFRGLADIIGAEWQTKITLEELDQFASSYNQDTASLVSDLEKGYEKEYEARYDALEKEYKKALASVSDDQKKEALEKQYRKDLEALSDEIHQKAVATANAALDALFNTYRERAGKLIDDAEKIIPTYDFEVSRRTAEDKTNAADNQAMLEMSDDFWALFTARSPARKDAYLSAGETAGSAQIHMTLQDIQDFLLEGLANTGFGDAFFKDYFDSLRDENGLINGELRFTREETLKMVEGIDDKVATLSEQLKTPAEITINQNFYVPAADPYTVQNAAKQGASAVQSGSYKLG